MKASELRIGNWIHTTYDVTVITEITESKVYDGFMEYEIEYIDGIPLTEEWLVKVQWDNTLFQITDNSVVVFQHGAFWINFNSEETKPKRIHFVHQLQNLYFALTGEELTIKN